MLSGVVYSPSNSPQVAGSFSLIGESRVPEHGGFLFFLYYQQRINEAIKTENEQEIPVLSDEEIEGDFMLFSIILDS